MRTGKFCLKNNTASRMKISVCTLNVMGKIAFQPALLIIRYYTVLIKNTIASLTFRKRMRRGNLSGGATCIGDVEQNLDLRIRVYWSISWKTGRNVFSLWMTAFI